MTDSITRRTALLAAGAVGLGAATRCRRRRAAGRQRDDRRGPADLPAKRGGKRGPASPAAEPRAAGRARRLRGRRPRQAGDREHPARLRPVEACETRRAGQRLARQDGAAGASSTASIPRCLLLVRRHGTACATTRRCRRSTSSRPNALHHRDVLAAAAAGKHVLCEKPMATSAREARDMVAACARAGVKLMVAYRMQYQPHAREAIRLARSGALGTVTLMDMVNNQNQGDPGQWRQKKALAGGGSLPDVGLYCLNTSRAILGEEPVAVTASIWTPAGDPRFAEVEDNVAFTLHFPSGAMSNCLTSYSTHELQAAETARRDRLAGDRQRLCLRRAAAQDREAGRRQERGCRAGPAGKEPVCPRARPLRRLREVGNDPAYPR